MVLGHEEVTQVARDADRFSSFNASSGPLSGFCPAPSHDVRAALKAYRQRHPEQDLPPVCLDMPEHRRSRTLCSKLFTPSRVVEHEPRIAKVADALMDRIAPTSGCEWVTEFAHPMTFTVVAELYGVPQTDQGVFMEKISRMLRRRAASGLGAGQNASDPQRTWSPVSPSPEELEWNTAEMQRCVEFFVRHLEERRAHPRDDLMGDFALTADRDTGELPPIGEIAKTAAVIFGGGQEVTPAHMFGSAMQILVDRPALQQELRDNSGLLENFVEEVLRFEPSLKTMHRIALSDMEVGGMEIPAGSVVALSWAAANRDPSYWTNPDEFDVHREEWRGTRTFGNGPHACPGAPLARLMGRVGFERILARTHNLRHAKGAGPVEYVPSFLSRVLRRLPIEWDWA